MLSDNVELKYERGKTQVRGHFASIYCIGLKPYEEHINCCRSKMLMILRANDFIAYSGKTSEEYDDATRMIITEHACQCLVPKNATIKPD